ncbi:MAG: leucine-rich repeat domain-containing protein, partial [Bacteroidales bacterium]|nr:leucine-rich repeat domain-containing protein [Bacteroidales bacterium]
MKKLFLLLTLLCLSLSARAHDAEVDGIFYNLDAANKTAAVTFKGDNYWDDDEYSGDVVIPETVTYNGVTYSVTSLGDDCFAGCSSLTAITIPNSVTSLGTGCFADCSSLERMVVDAANPVYDSREDCNAIIHTSTKEFIAGCKNSQIPNSVTSLGDRCFYGCSSLTAITIPNSVTSLGDFCFADC